MSTINREEAINIITSYPGPINKNVVRRLLMDMPPDSDAPPATKLLTTVTVNFTDEDITKIARQVAKESLMLFPEKPGRKSGKWTHVKKRLLRGRYVDASECSKCHKRIMPHLTLNFCPNCGAKMVKRGRRA